jgi:beta-hydroxylase
MAGALDERIAAFRKRRRKLVKRWGKRALRRLQRTIAAQSLVPDVPAFDASAFPWVKEIEAGWPAIRGEVETLLRYRAEIPRFYEVSPDQKRISEGGGWKTFVLHGWGMRVDVAHRLCPETMRLLAGVPRLENALFSILSPRVHIPRHTGVFKGLVRCHVPLIVPREREQCRMWVGDVPHVWEEGRALFFDDTFPHEVRNDTDEDRVVLLFDFHRPMRPVGRAVNAAVLAGLRRTAFVRDAEQNQRAFERRFEAMLDAEEAAAHAPPVR